MSEKKKRPLLSDDFLTELANEINQLFGKPDEQNNTENHDDQEQINISK